MWRDKPGHPEFLGWRIEMTATTRGCGTGGQNITSWGVTAPSKPGPKNWTFKKPPTCSAKPSPKRSGQIFSWSSSRSREASFAVPCRASCLRCEGQRPRPRLRLRPKFASETPLMIAIGEGQLAARIGLQPQAYSGSIQSDAEGTIWLRQGWITPRPAMRMRCGIQVYRDVVC